MNGAQKVTKCLAEHTAWLPESKINRILKMNNAGGRISDARAKGVNIKDKWMEKTPAYNRHKRYTVTMKEYKKHYG